MHELEGNIRVQRHWCARPRKGPELQRHCSRKPVRILRMQQRDPCDGQGVFDGSLCHLRSGLQCDDDFHQLHCNSEPNFLADQDADLRPDPATNS